jgi:hypothetical protein
VEGMSRVILMNIGNIYYVIIGVKGKGKEREKGKVYNFKPYNYKL